MCEDASKGQLCGMGVQGRGGMQGNGRGGGRRGGGEGVSPGGGRGERRQVLLRPPDSQVDPPEAWNPLFS